MKKLICLCLLYLGTAAYAATTEDALREISQMSPEQCRGAHFLNSLFYHQTQNMTELQRRAYFPQFVQQAEAQGIPTPRPPPHPESAIARALKSCAERQN